jgi:hypothetical protein
MEEIGFDEQEILEIVDRMERLEEASLPVADVTRPATLYSLCRARELLTLLKASLSDVYDELGGLSQIDREVASKLEVVCRSTDELRGKLCDVGYAVRARTLRAVKG